MNDKFSRRFVSRINLKENDDYSPTKYTAALGGVDRVFYFSMSNFDRFCVWQNSHPKPQIPFIPLCSGNGFLRPFPKKSPAGFWFPSLSEFLQIFLKKFSLFSKFPSVVKGILRERKVSHYEKASI
ncbi:hypothetical protein [Bifidobacterium pullorum]|uniref:Uncharacterized protein n=1 Tax=Bifidobacterium pullorum subsp. gallinarum TaxID=78344 RepID=A0A921LUU4_9BIFI|nr:hypothetical protein [Bifidobacterium pullorum]HJG41405.1 hypothetical protein [Bifidobacterium pullorum subsp. gallinarum]